jgi:uncharacterized membrane-anchored protein YitT (DUF2179 family)
MFTFKCPLNFTYFAKTNDMKNKAYMIRSLKNAILIITGIFSAAFGLKGFLLSSHFIDGGVTGISMLLSDIFGIPLYFLILLINLPFIALGYKQINAKFAFKSAAAIFGLAVCLVVISFPDVTPDKLLTAVFGGFFLGAGIGLSMRGGAVLDGTEIAALLVSQQYRLFQVGDVILIFNILIFGVAAFHMGIESALYSILTYIAASKTIDFLINGIEEYTGVTIVSEYSEEIRLAIIEDLRRGVTVYQGKRGFGKRGENSELDIIFTVITRLELPRLQSKIDEIDPKAFVIQQSVNDTKGGMIKKRILH